jgi:hypothetical protein|tara:strand:- start:1348 stop:1914 length:567 start_codon:yes stop_codon:yes gene_type:complete
MACTSLTKGRGLDCNRISGGVKAVYFAVFDQVLSTTESGGEVTDIDMGTDSIYKYVVPRGSTTVNESITGSTENGTLFYTPTLSMVLNKLTKEDQNEIKLLGQTQVMVFAQLNAQLANGHDTIVCLGRQNAMSLNAGTADSGASFGDRNGYTLTFDGQEAEPFKMVVDYTATPFDNADSGAQIPIVAS